MRRLEEHAADAAGGEVSLVRVNGIHVSLNQIVRQLGVADKLDFFSSFARRELVRQVAVREGVRTTPEDIQRDVDNWRYQHRLERVEDTDAWLRSRGISLGDVAEDARVKQLERALSDKVVDGRIEPYFAQHKLDYDEAEVCWIFHRNKGVIEEIGLQAREEGADFCRMAREFSQDERSRPSGGFVGRVRRGQLPKGIAARLFAAAPGEVFGPEKASGGFALYMLQRNFPAILDDRVSNEIRNVLFSQWLQREFQRAEIHYPIWETGKENRE